VTHLSNYLVSQLSQCSDTDLLARFPHLTIFLRSCIYNTEFWPFILKTELFFSIIGASRSIRLVTFRHNHISNSTPPSPNFWVYKGKNLMLGYPSYCKFFLMHVLREPLLTLVWYICRLIRVLVLQSCKDMLTSGRMMVLLMLGVWCNLWNLRLDIATYISLWKKYVHIHNLLYAAVELLVLIKSIFSSLVFFLNWLQIPKNEQS
jgi:hypothetical protein